MKRAVRRAVGLAVGIAVGMTARPPDRLTAQYRPEDRVVITDFSFVEAVAASPMLVFAATRHGLTLYDRQARAWRLPVTSLDGYPPARVRVALADAIENAVWLGTDDGWARFDAELRRWDSGPAPEGGPVTGLMLDANDPASGVFLESAAGWTFLPRGALVALPGRPLPLPGHRIAPLAVQEALNAAPVADAFRSLILTDPRLRSYTFTAGARSPDQREMFFGTNGAGIVRIDPNTGEWEGLHFGLLAVRAGGLALASGKGGGVWAASRSRVGERTGLTWIAADLSADSVLDLASGPGGGTPCLEGRRVLVSGSTEWIACERGVLAVDVRSHQRRFFDALNGLPSDNVRSLAQGTREGEGVWIGTAGGLARVDPTAGARPVGIPGPPVYALIVIHDTLWVGSTSGLGMVPPGASEVVVPADVASQPTLRAPVLLLARLGDTLVIATPDQLGWREPESRVWTFLRGRAELGRAVTLVGDPLGHGVWMGGPGGAAFWDIAHASFRTLLAPRDVPAAVYDIASDARYVWIATDSGLVRFTRAAVLGEGGGRD